jgi:23S rRNA pseudouridine2457 synthase
MPLVLLNKPFRVLCQFTDDQGRETLANFVQTQGVYPAGRLDRDSEGLLLLTDDGQLQSRISHPKFKLDKHYWVQVEGAPAAEQLDALRAGVTLKDGSARALSASVVDSPPGLWPRDPPIRDRQQIPTAWLDIVIDEGRNRMVRRMTAASGLPTLRLIRHRIGPWSLDSLQPGELRQIETEAAWRQLKGYSPPPFA